MRRAKLHYNADRWYAYCADRMGWQVGQWVDKFTDGGVESRHAADEPTDRHSAPRFGVATTAQCGIAAGFRVSVAKSGGAVLSATRAVLQPAAGVAPGPSTFNGTKADSTPLTTDAEQACHAQGGVGVDSAAASSPTPQVWRTRK